MHRCAVAWLFLLGGCLDVNPKFVDPTEVATQSPGSDGTSAEPSTSGPPATTDPPGTTLYDPTSGDTEGVSGMPPPACGDGMLNPDEQCDGDDVSEHSACPFCQNAVCGDGLWWIDGEQCDDGNDIDDDECSNSCVAASCGDGELQPGEQCDDGNQVNSDACVNCQVAKCGDSEVMQGPEECDDGNDVDGDGCDSTCLKSVKIIFVGSASFTAAQLGGVAGADLKCDTMAKGAQLPPGPYKAWLSDSFTQPVDSMNKSVYPYVKPNKQVVAMNWAGLVSGNLLSPIDITEMNAPAADVDHTCGPYSVHSNTTWQGKRANMMNHCGNWKSDIGSGSWGVWTAIGSEWSTSCEVPGCGSPGRIYCVQQ